MRAALILVIGAVLCGGAGAARAANHLDTPTVIADPRADIGDVFAWMAPDGRHLNLVMTIVGHTFSERLSYVFHVDSGRQFGRTTATTTIECRFASMHAVDCTIGDIDRASGDPSAAGLTGRKGHFRVFAGPRDDPFFNNVRGSRDAYEAAAAALRDGAAVDAAGCPRFSMQASQVILDKWRHTEGGAGKNFLATWASSAIVITVDLDAVAKGGKMLAVWGATATRERQLDRMGQPLTANSLLATLGPKERSNELKERYNLKTPATAAEFVPQIEQGLQLHDGFDGNCGNQLLADPEPKAALRYRKLAELLADDRLWINGESSVCTQFFAVELAHLAGQTSLSGDCGGRTINYDAIDVYRSLLVNGTTQGVDDGVDGDDHEHSTSIFPFLAPPDVAPANRK